MREILRRAFGAPQNDAFLGCIGKGSFNCASTVDDWIAENRILSLAIQTQDLTKRFPKPGRFGLNLPFAGGEGTLAVDRVNVEVGCGEVFGLVGPNGAGKTTLVKILSTLILPTAGTAWVNGHDLLDEQAIKSSIGLVTGNERSFYNR
ncbi:MAG: ATP-binding cassette domain-containing protein, partial [Anaerolineae bacterium]